MHRLLFGMIAVWGISLPQAEALDDWEWVNPYPTARTFRGAVAGPDQFIAVGASGAIYGSSDLATWTPRKADSTRNLFSVAYGNGAYVAVGDGVILSSLDGTTFATRSESGHLWTGVAFGNGRFVAAGTGIMVSEDGVSWTEFPFPFDWYLHGLDFIDGRFFGLEYTGEVHASVDGEQWSTELNFDAIPASLEMGPDRMVIVGSGAIGWSNGAGNIEKQSSTEFNYMYNVAFGNGIYVAVGGSYLEGLMFTSRDGATWTRQPTPPGGALFAVVFSRDTFLVAGDSGLLLTSPDGETWTQRTTGPGVSISGTAVHEGRFVAVGEGPRPLMSHTIMVSDDGSRWQLINTGVSNALYDVTRDSRTWVAVGQSGTVLVSGDSVQWTRVPAPTTNNLYQVSYGNGTFVASGQRGTLMTSPDGTNWMMRTAAAPGAYYVGAFAGGKFLIGGIETPLQVSTNGVDWQAVHPSECHGFVYGNGMFVARGRGAVVSSNAVDWVPLAGNIVPVGFGGGQFFGLSSDPADEGVAFSSTDLSTWTRRGRVPADVREFRYVDGDWYGFGGGGTVLRSRGNSTSALRITWNSGVPQMTITPPRVGARFVLQAAESLRAKTWVDLHAFEYSGEPAVFADPEASSLSSRFYRVIERALE